MEPCAPCRSHPAPVVSTDPSGMPEFTISLYILLESAFHYYTKSILTCLAYDIVY